MKKIKSYTGIWNVEKVLYAINDFTLPFPVTFTQITWFVITEFCFPFWCVSKKSPTFFEYFLLPYWTAYIGILAIIIGIIIRVIAVLTLKKAFTLNVQTTDKQVLVTTGIYTKVRNPAYSGSILSLIGVALALRNIFSLILIFLISIICYSIRIYVEEQALKKHFKKDFMNYQKHTYKLFPYIW